MDYTPNIDAQGMRRPMGPVDQPNWNGGPKLIHNPQVMNNQTVGQPNLANAMANQRPIIPIRGRIVTSEQDIVPAEIPMDGYLWRIKFVNPNDKMLMDRTGKMTLATTDPNLATIFMSRSLSGALLMKVLIHELGHCALVSYGLLDDIHKVVKPEYWILAEEWVCNFIADYGAKIFSIAYSVLGNDAWMFIPYELDKVIA